MPLGPFMGSVSGWEGRGSPGSQDTCLQTPCSCLPFSSCDAKGAARAASPCPRRRHECPDMTSIGSGAPLARAASSSRSSPTPGVHSRHREGRRRERRPFPGVARRDRGHRRTLVLVSALGWSQPWVHALPQRLFEMMNNSAIDVLPC